jgi:signal transduction histidine kinase
MRISFRARLFGIAALIVATVLAAVLLLGWSVLHKSMIDRLDERLCLEARHLTMQPVQRGDLPELEVDLLDKLRLTTSAQLMLLLDGPVEDDRQMQNWDGGIDLATLPWQTLPQDRPPPPPPGAAAPPHPPPGRCNLSTLASRGKQWHAAMVTMPFGRSVVAADLAAPAAELQTVVRNAMTLVIPLALLLTALGAWLMASLTMRPLNRLREAMKAVTGAALDQRLSGQDEDQEFGELIEAYNTMLGRLDISFHQATRFSADAAHELKTPLTILQGRIELAMQHASQGRQQTDLAGMQEEVARLTQITRKLLLLSQADAGQLVLRRAPVDLSALLEALLEDAHLLTNEQEMSGDIAPDLIVAADAVLLRQLLNNLISNAVRYCRAGGWITVTARALPTAVEIVIANATETIDANTRQHFFDRFFRGDGAHQRHIDGTGLGLSLAREIAIAHGGELRLDTSPEDQVRLRLRLLRE